MQIRQTRIDPAGFRRLLRDRRASYEPLFASGVWRLRELLPPIPSEAIVTLGEGNVPLYESQSGTRYAGVSQLSYLHLGMNPTGSFEDLGMTVAISAARTQGVGAVVCAGASATAVSMAAYASRAQLASYAIVPSGHANGTHAARIRDFGAYMIKSANAAPKDAVFLDSLDAYSLEGEKCVALLLLDALSWRVPDWVVLPGGMSRSARALTKGFREARMLGLIGRSPQVALVGIDVHVVDSDIRSAKAVIGREGIDCEAMSAASLAGIRALRTRDILREADHAVAILT